MSYSDEISRAETVLAEAKRALARDLAAVIKHAPWHKRLHDAHDVQALIDRIGELADQPAFFAEIHAAAETARNAQASKRGRGRPKKPESKKPLKPAKPAAPVQVVKTVEEMVA